jgi:hypothetical protein
MAVVIHEIEKAKLDEVLKAGLKKNSRGSKASDDAIIKADTILDENRPDQVISSGVSRDDNVYCYLFHDGKVIDITDGQPKTLDQLSQSPDQALLRLEIDSGRSFVADLELYDQIKEAVQNGIEGQFIKDLVDSYWQSLTLLKDYDARNGFRRPEVMVTYDIPSACLETVKS